jgi:sec-independent protein translocase protein TatC
MPILILILSVLHVVSPEFLLRNFRYAVLIITIIAAVVTPTTDIMNMMVFEVPMLLLYLLGVFFAWLVVRHREKKNKAA